MIIFISLEIKSQCELPYKPLSDFANDTTAFLMYNFRDRAVCYEGKELDDIIADLKMPIKDFMVIGSSFNANNAIGIYIYIYPREVAAKLVDKHKEPHTIEIIWTEDLSFKEALKESRKKKSDGWTKRSYKYFKGMQIREIRTVIYEYSTYYNKYYSKPNYEY